MVIYKHKYKVSKEIFLFKRILSLVILSFHLTFNYSLDFLRRFIFFVISHMPLFSIIAHL